MVGTVTVALPLGVAYLLWLNVISLKQLYEVTKGVGSINGWLRGPFLSYWITQPFIWFLSVVLGLIPGVNFASSFLLGWWANLDYYQYNYSLTSGPTQAPGSGGGGDSGYDDDHDDDEEDD